MVRKGLKSAMGSLKNWIDGCLPDDSSDSSDVGDSTTEQSLHCHIHDSSWEIISALAQHKPLSWVMLCDGSIGAMYSNRDMVKLSLRPEEGMKSVNGMLYKCWSSSNVQDELHGLPICGSGLLLPLLVGHPGGNWYTAITSRWEELHHCPFDPDTPHFKCPAQLTPKET